MSASSTTSSPHDGSLTPGEIRAYREAQFKARREAVSAKQGDADQNAAPQAGDDKNHALLVGALTLVLLVPSMLLSEYLQNFLGIYPA